MPYIRGMTVTHLKRGCLQFMTGQGERWLWGRCQASNLFKYTLLGSMKWHSRTCSCWWVEVKSIITSSHRCRKPWHRFFWATAMSLKKVGDIHYYCSARLDACRPAWILPDNGLESSGTKPLPEPVTLTGITTQGLPFLKIITCPISRILKFFDLLKCEIRRKNLFKSTCPTGSFTFPGPLGSGKR